MLSGSEDSLFITQSISRNPTESDTHDEEEWLFPDIRELFILINQAIATCSH